MKKANVKLKKLMKPGEYKVSENRKSYAVQFTNALTEIDVLRAKLAMKKLADSSSKTHDLEVVRTVVNIGSLIVQTYILLHLLGVL